MIEIGHLQCDKWTYVLKLYAINQLIEEVSWVKNLISLCVVKDTSERRDDKFCSA